MLNDYAGRSVYTTNTDRFHGSVTAEWNSLSEDYMGFALGYAAADAWFGPTGQYLYENKVRTAVNKAFSVENEPDFGAGRPRTLERDLDLDPNGGINSVMMRNHSSYSPVYATLLIKHVWDIHHIYQIGGYWGFYNQSNIPGNLKKLYNWLVTKIELNNNNAPVYRDCACATAACPNRCPQKSH